MSAETTSPSSSAPPSPCSCAVTTRSYSTTQQTVRKPDPRCPVHGRPEATAELPPCKVIRLTPEHYAEAQHCRDVETWVRAAGYTY